MSGETVIRITELSQHRIAAGLISRLSKAAQTDEPVILDLSGCRNVYPNGTAPAAAILDHFRKRGLKISYINQGDFLVRVSFAEPLFVTRGNLASRNALWNTCWRYEDDDQIFALSKALIEDLIERVEFGIGVLEALSWCLYEVLDNVLSHARSGSGFVMVQYLRVTRRLLVTVADAGIGIHRSFTEGAGGFRPRLAKEALNLAVSQWTSSTGERRGNGLFGLARVVEENGGSLELRSGRAVWFSSPNEHFSRQVTRDNQIVIDDDHHCTVVDFQLSVDRPVSLADVLGVAPAYNFEIDPLRDDNGVVVVQMSQYASKVATRDGAIGLRVRLLNYLAEGATSIALDFQGLGVISSSFADETLGRLVEHFGLSEFRRLFHLRNLEGTVEALVNRAIVARSDLA
jgi:anti-sigma regulatory factor (Ser/Thr protein kinase)